MGLEFLLERGWRDDFNANYKSFSLFDSDEDYESDYIIHDWMLEFSTSDNDLSYLLELKEPSDLGFCIWVQMFWFKSIFD